MSVTPLADAWRYDLGDPGIVLFTQALQAWKFDLPEGARVLELGCCESDWAKTLLAARPDVQMTGMDVRDCPDYPGVFIQDDAASHVWSPFEGKFDAIAGIGSIEHFGLGWHEYGDPPNEHGDTDALANAMEVLNHGGLVYFDVPWTPERSFQTTHWRCYSDVTLPMRLIPPGCIERARGWAKNEREWEFTQARPLTAHSPFYFTARWLTKVA
jgi:hypothetical protein